MNILLLGSGGREHALAWKMAQSPLCKKLYIAPGNAGTAQCGENLVLNPGDFAAVKKAVFTHNIQMVIVGPEAPLVEGIYDYFQADPYLGSVAVIGPSKKGAKLEGSKEYAKKFMQEWNIPTARYRSFTKATEQEGLEYLAEQDTPIVLKADGLAAGKGVLICSSVQEAQQEFREMLSGKFGDAGTTIVIEQFLNGIEFSVFALTDGKDYKILPVAKDYKRIGEGDTGLNTGGMGSVSPVSFVDEALMQKVEERIIQPTIKGIRERGIVYKGFVFFGLIRVDGDPYVIEYNCRLGDPETQVVLPRLKNDLVDLFQAVEEGRLTDADIELDHRTAATIILVSGGYPGSYEKGKVIHGLEKVEGSIVFHAGCKRAGENVLTDGGRVLAITTLAENMEEALAQSRKNAEEIAFEGKYFRRDIGFDL